VSEVLRWGGCAAHRPDSERVAPVSSSAARPPSAHGLGLLSVGGVVEGVPEMSGLLVENHGEAFDGGKLSAGEILHTAVAGQEIRRAAALKPYSLGGTANREEACGDERGQVEGAGRLAMYHAGSSCSAGGAGQRAKDRDRSVKLPPPAASC